MFGVRVEGGGLKGDRGVFGWGVLGVNRGEWKWEEMTGGVGVCFVRLGVGKGRGGENGVGVR